MDFQSIFRQRTHFIGIAIIAFCVIAYQVLLTRIFSVMLYYHFAFVGISLAMLGLTVGAQRVYYFKERFSPDRLEAEWAKAAIGFAVSMIGLTLGFIYSPLVPAVTYFVPLLICAFIVPFVYSGICITLILTKSEFPIGRLYAADLIGASLGCIGIVAVLFLFDPITVIFGLALLVALVAWKMACIAGRYVTLSRNVAALSFLLFALQGGLYMANAPHLDIVWAKGKHLHENLFERWNTFSLVRVGQSNNIPFGWGFGHSHQEPGPDQLALDIDAQAGTTITKFDGKNLEPVSYLADDVINAGYHLRSIDNAAVIGVGGGRDILSALYFGVPHVTGIELNPSIFEALTKRFADFSGHLDKRPDVSLVNAEARSWIDQSHRSFDIIQISLIDTWAATAAGGLSMSENKLYTVNAWSDFLDHLNNDGFLSVSRWFEPHKHTGEFYRLLSIAAETLKQRGVAKDDIKRHVLVFGTEASPGSDFAAGIVTIIVSPGELTPEILAKAHETADEHGFHLMMTPDASWDDTSRRIISGEADDAFYARLPLDLSAPTDDRPFFFHMLRMKDFLNGQEPTDDMGVSGDNNFAVKIVFALLGITLYMTLYFTFIPMLGVWKDLKDKTGVVEFLVYFAMIGLAFMLVEISQMQRLMIFLGHPVYGLTVVLFTLLLFGGIGSSAFDRLTAKGFPPRLIPLVLCIVLIAVGLATPALTEQFKVYGTYTRMMMSVALLAPAGFCMGMMFPLGMVASSRHRDLQPWFWSVNGATSVLGSVLGTVISMEYGIADAFWAGIGCYLLCLVLFMALAAKAANRAA